MWFMASTWSFGRCSGRFTKLARFSRFSRSSFRPVVVYFYVFVWFTRRSLVYYYDFWKVEIDLLEFLDFILAFSYVIPSRFRPLLFVVACFSLVSPLSPPLLDWLDFSLFRCFFSISLFSVSTSCDNRSIISLLFFI
jgi:hypothetical protein